MITLKDLAKELNVSVSTVSKALNNSYEISQETIEKVQALATKYNYKPNRAALSLKNSKTKTIGVIIPNILNPFFARSLHGIEQEASKRGYSIITCISNESVDKEKKSIELLNNGSVDGFIISVAEETQSENCVSHLNAVIDSKIPVVMFDRFMKSVDCDKVIIDDHEAIYDAANHLIQEGRKKIVLLNSLSNLNVGKLRVKGYTDAIIDSKLYKEDPIIFEVPNDNRSEERIEQILKEDVSIDGIIAIDNTLGVVALNIAKKCGYSIPNDISVIGFSGKNIIVFTYPKLTTITQSSEKIGRKAVELILDKIEKPEHLEKKTVIISTKLEHRETTKYN